MDSTENQFTMQIQKKENKSTSVQCIKPVYNENSKKKKGLKVQVYSA